MANCFCGCGSKIGLTPRDRRQANRTGEKIEHMLDEMKRDVEPWLDDGAAEIDALNTLPDAKSSKQVYDALLAEVQGHRSACLQVVHDAPFHSESDWHATNDWLERAEGLLSFAQLAPDSQKKLMAVIVGDAPLSSWHK